MFGKSYYLDAIATVKVYVCHHEVATYHAHQQCNISLAGRQ